MEPEPGVFRRKGFDKTASLQNPKNGTVCGSGERDRFPRCFRLFAGGFDQLDKTQVRVRLARYLKYNVVVIAKFFYD